METRADLVDATELMHTREKRACRRSLEHLPNLLSEGEKVERIIQGFYMTGTALSATNAGGGGSILVATDGDSYFCIKDGSSLLRRIFAMIGLVQSSANPDF